MRLSVIIGIILILVIPTTGMSLTVPSVQQTGYSSYDYNFTGMQNDAFPSNRSWIGFSAVNLTSPSAIGIENGHGFRGLQVSTYGYNGAADQFLNLSFRPSSQFSLRITFSWNYNNSVLSTGNHVEMGDNGSQIMGYKFGPLYNKATYLLGKESCNLGPDPTAANFYTLGIAWTGKSELLYSNIMQGWNMTMNLPYTVYPGYPFAGPNFNLLLGGIYSNITIYNIFLNSSAGNFFTPSLGTAINYSQESVIPDFTGITPNGPNWLPVVDQPVNSLLYFGNSTAPGIFAYNYYKNTSSEISALPVGFGEITSLSTSENAYFLSSNKTGSILTLVNLSSFQLSQLSMNMTFWPGTHLLSFDNNVTILRRNGSSITIMDSGGRFYQTFSHERNLGTLVSFNTSGLKPTISFLNKNETEISKFFLNSNGTLSSAGHYDDVLFDTSSLFRTENDSLPYIVQNLNISTGYNETVVVGTGLTAPMVQTGYYTFVKTSGNTILLQGNNATFAESGTSIIKTNIGIGSNFAYVSENLSFGLSVKGNELYLYYSGNGPFSGNNITLSFDPPKVIGGNVSLPYTIHSSLNYSVQASIGNLSLAPSSGYLNFSSQLLPNGTYPISLTAENIAGYSSTVERNISVDNFLPEILISPANNSNVLENSDLCLNITGLNGPVKSTVHFSGTSLENFSGTFIATHFPSLTGNVTLSLNVTDEFGVSRQYTYSFQILNISSTGYSTNIKPDSFLRNGNLNITWTPVEFLQYYQISVVSNSTSFARNTTHNYTAIMLSSGSYSLVVKALLDNSSLITLANENFTIQSFNPSLNLSYTEDNYFSFFGDSRNDTLNLTATTNVSVNFILNLTEGNKIVFQSTGSGNTFSVQFNSSYYFLRNNGIYNANITAKEESGRISWGIFNFSVNNTVPPLPVDYNHFYTNNSSPSIKITSDKYENSSYFYSNGTFGGYFVDSQSSIKLTGLVTKIIIHGTNAWGNTVQSNVTITESSRIPVIDLDVNPTRLVWNNTLQLHYEILDPVNLSTVSIILGNTTIANTTAKSGEVNYTLKADGNYTVEIYARDLCGNFNKSETGGIVCLYYPSIERLAPSIGMFMGLAQLNANIRGKDLEAVNYTWFIDGSPVSHSRSFFTILMPGEYNITLSVSYHTTTVESVHHVFTPGFVPEASLALLIGSILIYRRYGGSKDHEMAIALIMENLGKSKSEIYSIARKEKISIVTVEYAIKDMSSSGDISLLPDPDGVVYVMQPRKKM